MPDLAASRERRWLILPVRCLSAFLVVVNNTIVNVPIVIATFIAGQLLIPRLPRIAVHRFDICGVIISADDRLRTTGIGPGLASLIATNRESYHGRGCSNLNQSRRALS